MSDEDALLAAVCADPADDTVRLAFADCLDESGDEVAAAWAQFIRANLRLGTGTELAGDVPTVQRFGTDEWLARFAARGGFPTGADGASVGDWERGFPDRLRADYPPLRDRWDELSTRVPFRKLEVGGIEDEAVEDLVAWPRLDRLVSLELTTRDATQVERTLGALGVAALATCPALGGLDALALEYVEVNDRVADLLLGSPHLRRLRVFRFGTTTPWNQQTRGAFERLEARFGPGVFPWR